MAIDPIYNLKFTTIASVSGNDITVDDPSMLRDGDSNFIDADFLVWAAGETPVPSNSEFVRPTADSSGTFTLSRQQQSSSLRTIAVGDYIALVPSAKYFTDLQDQIDNMEPGGATDFTDLEDVPSDYTGQGEKLVAVKSDESGLEFVDAPSGGGGSSTPRIAIGTFFESIDDRWTKTLTGSATMSVSTTGLNIAPSASAGGAVRAAIRCVGGFSHSDEYHLSFVTSTYLVAPSGITEQYNGFGYPNVSGTTGITTTNKHVGIYMRNEYGTQASYYSCADGTTQSSGAFTASGSPTLFHIEKLSSSVKYYANGVLLGTLTTNIPTGAEQYPFGICVSNVNTVGNFTCQNIAMTLSKEPY